MAATPRGPRLPRSLYVLVFIHHDRRRERGAGGSAKAVDWATREARNLLMELAEQAGAVKFLIRDRDTKFTASFDAVFATDGIRIVKSPARGDSGPTRSLCG